MTDLPVEDRLNPWATVTRWIITINIVVFVLDWFVIRQPRFYVDAHGNPVSPVQPLLAFYGSFSYVAVLGQFQLWRLVTYQFCHANIEHIVVNMLALLLAGPIVEERLGRLRYLFFYLACGIAGPFAHLLLTAIGLMPFGIYTPLVGASASIYGVLVAAAMIAPNAVIELLFPPVDLRLKTLAWVMVLLSLVAVLWNWQNAGGHAAHLGGAVAGWWMMRRYRRRSITY